MNFGASLAQPVDNPSSPEISMITSISDDRSTDDDHPTPLYTLVEAPHEDPNAWAPKLLTTNELLGASADLTTAPPRPTGRVVLEALDTGSSALGSSVSPNPLSLQPPSALNSVQGGDLTEAGVPSNGAQTGEASQEALLPSPVPTLKDAAGGHVPAGTFNIGIPGGPGEQQGDISGAGAGQGGAGSTRLSGGGDSSTAEHSPMQTTSSSGGLLRSIPSFFQRGNGKGDLSRTSSRGGMSDGRSSQWDGMSSGRSYASGEGLMLDAQGRSWQDFPEGHNRERAQRHWRVLRVVLMALGMFRVAGLNRKRAKQLSAAEVKRGLRRNVTGGGQNVIPTMSFYSPKVTGNADASTAKYETLCKEWARFSPAIVHRMLRQKFLEHNTVEQEFTCERFSTTLLFADISGFTRLSARLNAEQLKIHTNQYFTMLIDVVARYGGDIIKFCGDAVMIIWPSEYAAPRGVLQANAMQASACALSMLSECGKYDVGKGEEAVALRLHCGMGSGNMYGYLVGGEDRWEYLVAGDPLRQIGSAEPEAKQGEVILSPESWELASTDFLATKTPQASVGNDTVNHASHYGS